MRYSSKDALVEDIVEQQRALCDLLGELPESRLHDAAVWGDGWTVGDLLAHLAEWHRMLLRWFREGQEGARPELPAPGYKWNETPRLNRAIREKHRGRPVAEVREEFESTHAQVLRLVRGLSEEDLLQAGRFDWTGKNALVTYVGANTASHYRFAQKVLKRWLRGRG